MPIVNMKNNVFREMTIRRTSDFAEEYENLKDEINLGSPKNGTIESSNHKYVNKNNKLLEQYVNKDLSYDFSDRS